MKKNYKIKTVAAAIVLLGLTNQANAQWAVVDAANRIQTTITAGATKAMAALEAYYKPRQDAQQTVVVQNTAKTNELLQAQTQQMINNNLDADRRMRVALGQADMAKEMVESFPSLTSCYEISKAVEGATPSNVMKSTNKNPRGGSGGADTRVKNITSTASALGQVLNQKKPLGTCYPEIAGSAGCAANETGEYARGDVQMRSVKGNIKGLNGKNPNEAEFNNYTFEDETAKNVAKKYANDSAYYDAPKAAPQKALEKNPSYAAMYENVMRKLNATNETINDVMKNRFAPEKSTVLNDIWKDVSENNFKRATGLLKKPETPSLTDMLNYQASNDFLGGDPDNPPKLDSIEEVNKRLALNNFLLWQQVKNQENQNIVLAHILTQLTTPTSKAQVDAEFNKTMSYAPKSTP